jgi:hypothetical protein
MKKREREKQQSNHTKVQQFIRNERRKAATRKGKSIKHMHNTRYKMMMTKCSSSFLGLCVFSHFYRFILFFLLSSVSLFVGKLDLSQKIYRILLILFAFTHTRTHARARTEGHAALSVWVATQFESRFSLTHSLTRPRKYQGIIIMYGGDDAQPPPQTKRGDA